MPDELTGLVTAAVLAVQEEYRDAVGIQDALWLAAVMAAGEASPADEPSPRPGAARRRRRFGRLPSIEARGERAREATRAGSRAGPGAAELFDSRDAGAAARGLPARRVTLASPPALGGKLELARAVRPFRQFVPSRHRLTLDVEATVRASAAAPHPLPVFRPAAERRYSADLVLDASPSMAVWESVAADLAGVLSHAGVFREVRSWTMHAGDGAGISLRDRSGNSFGPEALRQAGRRRLVVIVTDAVGEHWYEPAIWQQLAAWGRDGMVALVDLLPLKLWRFSGVGADRVRAWASVGGAVNAELSWNPPRRWRLRGYSADDAVPVPVLELSPVGLNRWAAMAATAHPAGNASVLVDSGASAGASSAPARGRDTRASLVNFLHTASPEALRLAVLAATAESTTLAVLRAIQQELLPGSPVSDLAEVLVSGIFQHVPDTSGMDLRLRMNAGCRAELQALASPQDSWDVYRAVSAAIRRASPASAGSFQAAVHDPEGDITVPEDQLAFAEIASSALARVAPSRTTTAPSRPEPRTETVAARSPRERPPGEQTSAEPDDWDFFVSYAQADRQWAEWIAWQLEEAGYRVLFQAWDMVSNRNWLQLTQEGVTKAAHTIAVLSPDYLASQYGTAMWQAVLAQDPDGARRKLLPVRVADCERPGLLSQIVSLDLFGLTAEAARDRLREKARAVVSGRIGPDTAAPFPARHGVPDAEPRFPEALPAILRIPPRNPNFVGRGDALAALGDRLAEDGIVTVQGLGGVGKAQLAIEYAYAHASDYDLVFWVPAEEPGSIPDQFTVLAQLLRLDPVPEPEGLQAQVHDALRRVHGWLLIFANADTVEDTRPWLPRGPQPPGAPGHVIVTARRGGFAALGSVLDLDILDPRGALALLRTRVPDLPEDIGTQIAEELGGLPLALEQAAAYLDLTGLPPADYLALLRTRGAEILSRGQVAGRTDNAATGWNLSLERIGTQNPAAISLLDLCAYLASEPIPEDLFTAHPDLLPGPLSQAAGDPLAFNDVVGVLVDYSMVKRTPEGLQVHRLIQAAVRARHSDTSAAVAVIRLMGSAVSQARLERPERDGSWLALVPHAQALLRMSGRVPESAEEQLTSCAADIAAALLQAGLYPAALDIAETGLRRRGLPEDHPAVLWLRRSRAAAWRLLGRPAEAEAEYRQVLEAELRILGPYDPSTLATRNEHAVALSDTGRWLDAEAELRDVLDARMRILGPDHPDTLATQHERAVALAAMGRHSEAADGLRDVLDSRLRILGPDHPDTLATRHELAAALAAMGRSAEAEAEFRRLNDAEVRVLGPDHPSTLITRYEIARTLEQQGRPADAEAEFRAVLDAQERILGPDHPDTLATRNALGPREAGQA